MRSWRAYCQKCLRVSFLARTVTILMRWQLAKSSRLPCFWTSYSCLHLRMAPTKTAGAMSPRLSSLRWLCSWEESWATRKRWTQWRFIPIHRLSSVWRRWLIGWILIHWLRTGIMQKFSTTLSKSFAGSWLTLPLGLTKSSTTFSSTISWPTQITIAIIPAMNHQWQPRGAPQPAWWSS